MLRAVFLALAVCAAVQSTKEEGPGTGDGVLSAPSVHGDETVVRAVSIPATAFDDSDEGDNSTDSESSSIDECDNISNPEEYWDATHFLPNTRGLIANLPPLVVVDISHWYGKSTGDAAGADADSQEPCPTGSASGAALVSAQTATATAQAGRECGSTDTQLSVCDAVRRLSFAEHTLGLASGMALYALAVAAFLSAHFRADATAAILHFCGDYLVNMVYFYATTELLGARLPELIDRVAAAQRWPHAAAEVVHTLLVAVLAAGALNAMLGAGALVPGLRIPDDFALAGGAVGAHELRLLLAVVAVRYICAVLTRLAYKLEGRINQQ